MKEKIKVAVIFNEAHPEFYQKTATDKKPDFIPYFEVDVLNPIEEYHLLTERLRNDGFNAYSLNISDNIITLIDDLKKNKPDVIFNFVEIYKENARLEMNIVGIMELSGIPYTGASPLALSNCQNKALSKRLMNYEGLKIPQFIFIKEPLSRYNHTLNFPLIIKPAYEDASVGIENESIVNNNKELKARVNFLFSNFNQPALVEEYIDGRELNVALLGDKNPEVLPISEIDFNEMPDHLHKIVSYQAKWNPHHEAYHKTIPICPANLPKDIEEKAKELAIKAFTIMGCRDYARIDMRFSSSDNELYILEVNPNPDLTEGAGFMRSAEAAGLNYVDTLKIIIELALKRGNKNQK
jgi:D-alanine-D-alanine ligase